MKILVKMVVPVSTTTLVDVQVASQESHVQRLSVLQVSNYNTLAQFHLGLIYISAI